MEAVLVTVNAGEIMATYRRAAGLTQAELASAVGLKGSSAISQFERGIDKPMKPTAESIDLVLEAGGAILAAYGFSPPKDWGEELAAVRVELEFLKRVIREMANQLDLQSTLLDELDGGPGSAPSADDSD